LIRIYYLNNRHSARRNSKTPCASLKAERATLARLSSDGIISEAVYEELVSEVDAKIENVRSQSAAMKSDGAMGQG